MERTVSRAELRAPDGSPPSSPELADTKQIQEFDFVHHEELPDAEDGRIADEGEDGFSFQLFASITGPATVAKIRLDSPDLSDGAPGLLQPDRDSRYYFTGTPGLEQQQNFEAAAISGADVLEWSKSESSGTAYSWKVFHVPTTKKQYVLLKSSEDAYAKLIKDSTAMAKRARPGKKARIAGRVKLATEKISREAEQKAAEAKEIQEREKKIRRNREKKLKKKAKAKAQKADAVNSFTEIIALGSDAEESQEDD